MSLELVFKKTAEMRRRRERPEVHAISLCLGGERKGRSG